MAASARGGDEGPSDSAELAGVEENQKVAAAGAASVLKTAGFDQGQASVKVARSSILEAIWDQTTAGGQELRKVPPGAIGQRTVSRGVVSVTPSIVCR